MIIVHERMKVPNHRVRLQLICIDRQVHVFYQLAPNEPLRKNPHTGESALQGFYQSHRFLQVLRTVTVLNEPTLLLMTKVISSGAIALYLLQTRLFLLQVKQLSNQLSY